VGLCRLSPLFNSQYSIKVALVLPKSNSNEYHQHQPTNIRSSQPEAFVLVNQAVHHIASPVREHFPAAPPLTSNINHYPTHPVKMTPAHPQAANRPRLILRSDSFTHEDLSAAFAASASQPRTKDLKIRIAQKDETPAPPPSPTEAFSSHRP
jgi:hypothetical protein